MSHEASNSHQPVPGEPPCHALPKERWCDRDGPGAFMGHTCYPPPPIDTTALASDVLTVCERRGWSMHWTHRGAYLHLESSELIEAIRGKHGNPLAEAGDVLLVLMSITQYHGIPWGEVERAARLKCSAMMVRPRYPGEEHDGRPLGS